MSTSATPKKDVIYVDIEDDITSVIEKVKNASAPIVALVPPKRIGVLQSVVNLKLLARAAKGAKKHIVLISSDKALMALAAGLALPVAKNLQSKPEIPVLASEDAEGDEIIHGDELPVGDHARSAGVELPEADDEEVIAPAAEDVASPLEDKPMAATAAARAPKKGNAKKGSVIPNFDTFRKKLFLFGGLGVAALVFLVWAIFFAPHATVSITAKTNIVNLSKTLQLRPSAKLDTTQAIAASVVKEIKKTATVDFTATGTKNVGEKATATVKFSQQSLSSTAVPAGTKLTSSSGLIYVTDSSVTVPASSVGGPGCFPTACPGTVNVGVTAAEGGAKYNAASGSLSGGPTSASFVAPSGGGTDKTATVVAQADVDKAKEQLQAQKSDEVKSELLKQFDATTVVIQESYKVTPGNPTSAPAVDQEATAAKLSAETTYRIVGIARSDLRAIYDAFTKTQITGQANQKIYASGDEATSFARFEDVEGGFSVKATATAQVGPNIDEKTLATQLTGKRAGEIQQQIELVPGVEDVTVKFSPFWVTKAPGKADKIDIKFVIKQ